MLSKVTTISTHLEGALVCGKVVAEARLGVLDRVEQHERVQGAHERHHKAVGRDQAWVGLLLPARTRLPGVGGEGGLLSTSSDSSRYIF